MTRRDIVTMMVWATVILSNQNLWSATLRLRSEFMADKSLVTLGDVVAIDECDPETRDSLSSLVLFPAPPMGEARFVSRDEIRDLLILRGIDVRMHDWTGASQIRIVTSPKAAPASEVEKNGSRLRRRAEERFRTTLDTYWRQSFPDSPKYGFEFTLSPADINWFSAIDARVAIKNVQPLSSDTWIVEVRTQVGQDERVSRIEVRLTRQAQLVLAARPLSRDVIITSSDVMLGDQIEATDAENAVRIEDVVGKQLTVSIPAGKPIPRSALRDPVVIRRGDVVQVVVRAPGLTVRTAGRAKDDGVLGRLVPVETLESKGKTIMARVAGPKEVEIFAVGVQAGG